MPYRVGIFDPAFTKEGHFIAFNQYVAELLDNKEFEVTFLDLNGSMREAYEGKIPMINKPKFKTLVEEKPLGSSSLFLRHRNMLLRLKKWKDAYHSIAELDLDLVLVTSESYDPFMYLFKPSFKYGLFILNPRLYIYLPKSTGSLLRAVANRFYALRYKALVHGASFLVTTNEPSMISGLTTALDVKSLPWLPNLDIKQVRSKIPVSNSLFDFITIGTLSRSKSHLLALSAFKKYGLPYRYLIAGLPRDTVGREVENQVHKLERDTELTIQGEFGYISNERYVEILRSTRYCLLPYDFTRGNISSQVMHDCFKYGVPIIAPNIEPFTWYVERYGIGLLYKEGDISSLAEVVKQAMNTPLEIFSAGFARLQQDHAIEAIRNGFLPLIRQALAN